MINAAECGKKTGKYSFGVDEARTAQALRKLADEIDQGVVALYSVSTSTRSAHEEFTMRELVIEVMEVNSSAGPRMIKS